VIAPKAVLAAAHPLAAGLFAAGLREDAEEGPGHGAGCVIESHEVFRVPLDPEHPTARVFGFQGLHERARDSMDAVQVPPHGLQAGGHVLHGLMVSAVHQEIPSLQVFGEPRIGGQDDAVTEFGFRLRQTELMAFGGAIVVLGHVLDEASSESHVEDLMAAADAQDGDASGPGLAHERDLTFVPRFVGIGMAMEGLLHIPMAGVDVPSSHQQEARDRLPIRKRIPRLYDAQRTLPATLPHGGQVVALHTGSIPAGNEKARHSVLHVMMDTLPPAQPI